MFSKGTKMYLRTTGEARYEKLGDKVWDEWVCLKSTYQVWSVNEKGESVVESRPESEKPLYNEHGKLNRFGFKWTDQQVWDYYKGIMTFGTDADKDFWL